jgi:lysophospholipase L1-like esterase
MTGSSVPSRFARRSSIVVALTAFAAGCGGHHGPTAPDPGDSLAILCPADQAVDDLTNAPTMPVTFPAPSTMGGKAPVTVQCTPASGTNFALGQTPVSCGATDTGGHFAACAFNVTVSPVPMLSVTSFMAFGDSLTEGEVQPQRHTVLAYEPEDGYPAQLLGMLRDRYRGQTITLSNYGLGGADTWGDYPRLLDALAAEQPQALLLLEGINDLDGNASYDEIPHVIDGLRADVRESLARGVQYVLVSTLTPQREPTAGSPERRNFVQDPQLIRDTNDEIREMAAQEGAILVDGYAAIAVDVDRLVGADGLHLTIAGYQALANAFFVAIEQHLELPPPVPTSSGPSSTERR